MATSYTQHYGLCQWVPGDKFLREEFNGDNQKIEAALRAAEGRARALEPVAYHVYQLMLRNYYDGKPTGAKRALVLDGFADEGQVESLTTALSVDTTAKTLVLQAGGDEYASVNFGGTRFLNVMPNYIAEVAWTVPATARLTGVKLFLEGSGVLTLYQNDAILFSMQVTGTGRMQATTLPCTAALTAGAYCRMVYKSTQDSFLGYVNNSTPFGYALELAPLRADSGSMVSRPYALPGGWSRAICWVRHTSGQVGAALAGADGTYRSMVSQGTISGTGPAGESCLETSFTLDRALTGPLRVKLNLTANGRQNLSVYDYGVALL